MSSKAVIRSRSNPLIRQVGSALAGKLPGTLVLEGQRLVEDALRVGLPIELVLVSDLEPGLARALEDEVPSMRVVDEALLQRVSQLGHSSGVIALAPEPPLREIAGWRLDERSLILVAAGLSNPGNLGALARSAEALGAQGLVTIGGVSPWNPRALRGSMGSLLRLPVVVARDAPGVAQELGRLGVRQACAATRDGTDAASFDWRGPLALWVGDETGELPSLAQAFEPISIPMAGRVESLNVTVATALLLYASGRVGRGEPSDG